MNCANHPDRERVVFCQNCGKPLCSECTCTIGTAVFCEPCLAARIAAANAGSASTESPYGYAAAPLPPSLPEVPNPALAGLLGLIPGVGAMYNGQYAKGIVHLVIFAVLVSLSETNGLFGLFIAGWIFYQVIEAHHTARARRDGTPLPNPFGLNDIGEKLGFGKSWPTPTAPRPTPSASDAEAHFSEASSGSTPFTEPANDILVDAIPGASPSGWSSSPAGSYASAVPPAPSYGTPFPVEDPLPPTSRSRFPIGATLLIVLGLLFFFRSSGWFPYFSIHRILPLLLIAASVWIFLSKMTWSGLSMADDDSAAYRFRLFRALRGSIWIFLIGVLFFLDTFRILSWSHSWPLFIIVAGLMKLFERSTCNYVTPTSAGATTPYDATPASQHEEGK
jgi:hypothetical protein